MTGYQMNKSVKLVYDMQYGSTGKGLLIGKLCEEAPRGTVALSSMAPNAGHTYVAEDGTKFIHSALPLGVAFPSIKMVGVGPGSTVDMVKFARELEFADKNNIMGCGEQSVIVHEHAAVLTEEMTAKDAKHLAIGSTMKGAGAAQVAKIERSPATAPCMAKTLWSIPEKVGRFSVRVVTHAEWLGILEPEPNILIEGSQGYSLGLTSGMWPYTTYRECTPTQILTDVAVPCRLRDVELYGVMRTYPIRVANRRDQTGAMVGYSGPGYPDQEELTWDELGLDPEYTTVTKLERRVFDFSILQLRDCLRHTRPDVIFLNFMNYLDEEDVDRGLALIKEEMTDETLLLGYGPKVSDIREEPK